MELKKSRYTIIHAFYAFIVAMALAAIVNAAICITADHYFDDPAFEKLKEAYAGSSGIYFVLVTVVLALCFYPFTRKLKIGGCQCQ